MSIEREAQEYAQRAGPTHGATATEIALMSQAISLKRIADALEGTDAYALNNLMENAGQAFALGMRGR